ncbi:MAG: hypothetical protein H6741_03390 [Alphaproteobacteria bacterium]|nr:hypothetical protein [Alphaproteobacteria bacterium]
MSSPHQDGPGIRPLSEAERRYAWELFVESIDLGAVRIARDSLLSTGPPKVLGNTVHMPTWFGEKPLFEADGSLTPAGRRVLIHELGHVWQYQHGGYAYVGDSLWAQLIAMVRGEGRSGAYAWQRAARGGVAWEEWNPEQQAAAIEHYDTCRRRVGSGEASENDHKVVSALLPIIEKVRRGEGATAFSRPGAVVVGLGLALLLGLPTAFALGETAALVAGALGAALGARVGGGRGRSKRGPASRATS